MSSVDCVLASAVTRTSTSSPAGQHGVAPGDDQPVPADHRHHGGVAGDARGRRWRSRPPGSPRPGSPRPGGRCPPGTGAAGPGEPTETASSTRAVRSWGVDTETSTPQLSLNSHWFFGWLTRATTRGTANSCLASREITRLSSSSPVAATTTSTVASPAASSEAHLAGVGGHPGDVRARPRSRATSSGSCSMTRTSWPAGVQVAGDGGAHAAGPGDGDLHDSGPGRRPTGAAPPSARRRHGDRPAERSSSRPGVLGHHQVEDVALLADQVAAVEAGTRPGSPPPGSPRPGTSRSASRRPAQRVGEGPLDQRQACRWSRTTPRRLVGQQPAADLVDGPGHGGHRGDARGAGRSRPGGGRRSGPPRWGSRRSPGRCGRSGCWCCRRWSRRPGRRPRRPRPGRGRRGRSPSRRSATPAQSSGRRRKAWALRSMMATEWPCGREGQASPEPTRPQPTTTMCTPDSATRRRAGVKAPGRRAGPAGTPHAALYWFAR